MQSDCLSTTGGDKTVTLTALKAELSVVAAKWYYIGIQLKISNKTLNAIRLVNRRNREVCMMRVCEEWIMQQEKCDKVPDWSTIIEVLRSKVISETDLADSIYQKYCSDEPQVEYDEEEEPTSKSYTWVRLKLYTFNCIQ